MSLKLFVWGRYTSDVKSLRPKWPRGQNFGPGLGLEALASASASISLSYYVIGNFSCKNRVKFRNFVNFSGNNLKSYVVNHYLVLFHNYIWPRPRPRPHSPGLGLGLGLVALASASASRFWPRLASLLYTRTAVARHHCFSWAFVLLFYFLNRLTDICINMLLIIHPIILLSE